MATYKTPDVYVEEISLFPPSVAEVETAIPAFIGYTESALKNGAEKVQLVPTRIKSLAEYHEIFGWEPPIKVKEVNLDVNNAVVSAEVESSYFMYDSLRMFFSNGGGKCYIVSIGFFKDNDIKKDHFLKGVEALKKQDEPTILLFPDAVLLPNDGLYSVQQAALKQCGDLGDRVAVFDLYEKDGWEKGYNDFRDKIGINDLKYAAAYTPHLVTNLSKKVRYADVNSNLKKSGNPSELKNLTTEQEILTSMAALNEAITDNGIINGDDTVNGSIKKFLKDQAGNAESLSAGYLAQVISFKAEAGAAAPTIADVRAEFKKLFEYIYTAADKLVDDWAKVATELTKQEDPPVKPLTVVVTIRDFIANNLKEAFRTLNSYNKSVNTKIGGTANEVNKLYAAAGLSFQATQWGSAFTDGDIPNDGNNIYPEGGANNPERIKNMIAGETEITKIFVKLDGVIQEISAAAANFVDNYENSLVAQFPLLKSIMDKVGSTLTVIPPSGAVAGVYAKVDRTRGVWKAPANVSLSDVSKPTQLIDNKDQAELNVDTLAGKSINAIRAFTGKGVLVWGARTLAGNDNEWRYISVRRFFNMVEESVKKSTYWAVFENNDANTWVKVKSMIENYLIQKWRDGALAGAKPEQAFFVKVGLGTTMTQQDILEGRMNVEIGMAVVRPAEFIILKFSHKMQES